MAEASAGTAVAVKPPTVDLKNFKAVHAAILSMELAGQAGHVTADIRYVPGKFTISTHVHSGPSTLPRDMTPEEIKELRAALEGQAKQTIPGADMTALETVVEYLERGMSSKPSGRFDHVRFGEIHKDPAGMLIGSLGIGIDVVGVLHDAQGEITLATHVVPLKGPGQFHKLSKADEASLASALEKYIAGAKPKANPLWEQVLRDLKK
jgi:hypothetical protein